MLWRIRRRMASPSSLRDFLPRALRMSARTGRYLGALPDRLLPREGSGFFRRLIGSISGGIAFSSHLSRGRDGFGPVFRSSSRSRPSTKRVASSKLILRPIISASNYSKSPLRPAPFSFRHLGSQTQGGAREVPRRKEARARRKNDTITRGPATQEFTAVAGSLGLTGIRLQMKNCKQQCKRRRLRLAEFDGARSAPQLFERFRLASSVIVKLHAALWAADILWAKRAAPLR
jgi:hypothetical protein